MLETFWSPPPLVLELFSFQPGPLIVPQAGKTPTSETALWVVEPSDPNTGQLWEGRRQPKDLPFLCPAAGTEGPSRVSRAPALWRAHVTSAWVPEGLGSFELEVAQAALFLY